MWMKESLACLAQEESRSISENVTWGQRKRMADGKVSFAYSRFFGLDKDKETGKIVVNSRTGRNGAAHFPSVP